MAYDQKLADRVERAFRRKGVAAEVKGMIGGLCFMVEGKMCVGVVGDRLMARIDPDGYEAALARPACRPMDFTGRPMRGFVSVEPAGIATAAELEAWLELALACNPRAKASKKRPRAAGRVG